MLVECILYIVLYALPPPQTHARLQDAVVGGCLSKLSSSCEVTATSFCSVLNTVSLVSVMEAQHEARSGDHSAEQVRTGTGTSTSTKISTNTWYLCHS